MLRTYRSRKLLSILILLSLALLLSINPSVLAQGPDFKVTPLTPVSGFDVDTAKEGAPAGSPPPQGGAEAEPEPVPLGQAPSTGVQAPEAGAQGLKVDELRAVSIIVTFDQSVDVSALAAVSGGQVIHRYSKIFNGASLVLAGDKVDDVAALNGVTGVYLDELLQLDTERSPSFIGAPALWDQLGGQGSAGEGVIVGVLDTGVWPEHPSYSDPDPSGKPYPPPPVVPGSNGFGPRGPKNTCDFGNTAYNPNDAPFTCNNKLIGAYSFIDTYKAVIGLLPEEFDSARDADGHGTHTSSTAAGNGGVEASIFGVPRGTISGIAPRAHVIMYKVCGDLGCFSSDSAAAVEQAILDEVDAINFSISGGNAPYSDIVELAFLKAYENGTFVAASAGNSGPGPDTVAHRGPWTMTVGASTTDRHFLSTVSLTADNGDTLTLTGASVTDGIGTPTPVVFPPAGEELCLDPFPAGTFSGEIVICRRGAIARVEKSFNVAAGGAGGMLLYNPTLQGLATDNHFIPSVHLENDAGADLLNFMSSHTGVTATFTPGTATTVQGDVMAAFSSRGGPGQTLGVSKPDITAPGVQILAGHTPLPATVVGGLPGQLFQAIQGTSMSSPHIAGSAALLKDLHPDWTPGQIKSAMMTTANPNHVKEDGVTPADPFDFGSGRIDLARAGDPGLTFSATAQDFRDLENELWHANYPSLYVPIMPGRITVKRTVHSELSIPSVWRTSVDSPSDVTVLVPPVVPVPPGGDKTFPIVVDARHVPLGEVRHATLTLQFFDKEVRFPITIVRNQPAVTLDKSCDPDTLPRNGTTDCTITISNTSFDEANVSLVDILPRELRLVNGSVVGGNQIALRAVTFEGSLFGAQPPIVTVVDGTGTTPAGYLPLSAFGVAPIGGVGDETIVNFSVGDFVYAGETYNTIGMVSNGYAVVGGGTGADVDFINQTLPDPEPPNNVLAPFWTDLNPAAGGALRAAFLSDGVTTWVVLDWENVPNFGDGELNNFQIWVGLGTVEDISFTYGPSSDGDGGFLTVGAENKFGNSGENYYVDGVGTLPTDGSEVRVTSVPGEPGETHTITFSAKGRSVGSWTNCAQMTGDIFFGTNIDCFSGQVTP